LPPTGPVQSSGAYGWYFYSGYGSQFYVFQSLRFYAVAVRPGDVAAAVPEPQTWVIMLMGLAQWRLRFGGGHVEALTLQAL
jgi:hypothetical protein